MLSFDEVWSAHAWEAIPECPGRFRLVTPRPSLAPAELAGAGAVVVHLSSPACKDPVEVVCLAEGGAVLSYRRADGSYVHTLNSPCGLERKLAQLGLVAVFADAQRQAARRAEPD